MNHLLAYDSLLQNELLNLTLFDYSFNETVAHFWQAPLRM